MHLLNVDIDNPTIYRNIYIFTIPCNLSLVACFLTLMLVTQGNVATYARCGGILNSPNHFTANLLENFPVKELWRSVMIWQNSGHEFGVQFFQPTLRIRGWDWNIPVDETCRWLRLRPRRWGSVRRHHRGRARRYRRPRRRLAASRTETAVDRHWSSDTLYTPRASCVN